jgi:TPR repeat protein
MRVVALILSLVYVNLFAEVTLVQINEQRQNAEQLKDLKLEAEKGNAVAQCSLGRCYASGKGVIKDQIEAVKWYYRSAYLGNISAQIALGLCYQEGEGVDANLVEAYAFYNLAGVTHPTARQLRDELEKKLTGSELRNGQKRSKELKAVIIMENPRRSKFAEFNALKIKAEQGNVEAQLIMGNLYLKGEDVLKDHEEAFKWYLKAAEQGNAIAQFNIGFYYYKSDLVDNTEVFLRNRVEAVKWFRKAAEQGNADAQCYLGDCYSNGFGVVNDQVEAVKWFRKAFEQGDICAQCNLGMCYANGEGVVRDLVEAYAYLNLAGVTDPVDEKNRKEIRMQIKGELAPSQIEAGEKRSKELQKEIDANLAKKARK